MPRRLAAERLQAPRRPAPGRASSTAQQGTFVRYAIADDGVFELCDLVCGGLRQPGQRARPAPHGRRSDDRESCSACHVGWPLERVLFAMAGTMTLLSALLVVVVSPWFLLLTAFVGVNQWLYVVVGACPASLVLGRALRPALGPVPGGGRSMTAVRPDRPARPLHRHPLPHGRDRLGARRRRARLLRAESRARPLRRRLGGHRLASPSPPARRSTRTSMGCRRAR